jgi:hypothetical protein
MFSLSLMATVALYAFAGMIVYGIFWLFARSGRLVQRRKTI